MWKGHLPDALNWKLLEAIRAGDWGCRVLSSEGIFGFKSICLGWFGGGPGDKAIEACLWLSFAVLSWGPRHPQPPLCSALFPTGGCSPPPPQMPTGLVWGQIFVCHVGFVLSPWTQQLQCPKRPRKPAPALGPRLGSPGPWAWVRVGRSPGPALVPAGPASVGWGLTCWREEEVPVLRSPDPVPTLAAGKGPRAAGAGWLAPLRRKPSRNPTPSPAPQLPTGPRRLKLF